MVTPEIVQAVRQDRDREVAHLRLVREARRLRSEETPPVVRQSRRVWRWKVEQGAEEAFEALRSWLLAPYAKPTAR